MLLDFVVLCDDMVLQHGYLFLFILLLFCSSFLNALTSHSMFSVAHANQVTSLTVLSQHAHKVSSIEALQPSLCGICRFHYQLVLRAFTFVVLVILCLLCMCFLIIVLICRCFLAIYETSN